jgi:hypothetical protein
VEKSLEGYSIQATISHVITVGRPPASVGKSQSVIVEEALDYYCLST